jgi:hypothetical protein
MKIFNAGEGSAKLDLVKGGVEDMHYYLERCSGWTAASRRSPKR